MHEYTLMPALLSVDGLKRILNAIFLVNEVINVMDIDTEVRKQAGARIL